MSALQFDRNGFVSQVMATLQETGLAAAFLELELTERVVGELEDTTRKMQALNQLG